MRSDFKLFSGVGSDLRVCGFVDGSAAVWILAFDTYRLISRRLLWYGVICIPVVGAVWLLRGEWPWLLCVWILLVPLGFACLWPYWFGYCLFSAGGLSLVLGFGGCGCVFCWGGCGGLCCCVV